MEEKKAAVEEQKGEEECPAAGGEEGGEDWKEKAIAEVVAAAAMPVMEPKETKVDVMDCSTPDGLTETPSFQEESYSVGDLKEGERKALEAFRLKIEEAIKNKTILTTTIKTVEVKVVEITETSPVSAPECVEIEKAIETEDPPPRTEAETPVQTETVAPTDPLPTSPPDVVETPASEKREILIEATPPESPPPQNFYLWGIPVHEGDDKTDALLLKFLRARNFKVDDALSMLKSTVKWRKEFKVDSIEEEQVEGAEEFERWAFLHGVDREGHPVCYNRNVFHSRDMCEKAKFGKFLRWRVQSMEKSIKSHLDFSPGGVHSFVQVIDLQNSPGLIKGAQAMKKFVSLLQDNYPELATKQIVLNMPWWYFPALYRVFKLDPKVVWAGPGKTTQTLFKCIAPDQVPIQYGGLGRPNDIEFQGVEAPVTQLIVKAGEKYIIELPIEEGGATLVWDVSVVGWDVVYGEEFVPSTYTVIITKPKKLASSTEPMRNTFKASEPGKVVLTIDNSISKKKKMVIYRSTCKRTTSS